MLMRDRGMRSYNANPPCARLTSGDRVSIVRALRTGSYPLLPAPVSGAVRWNGAVAQLGERLVRNEEVSGSIPLSSTIPPYQSRQSNTSVKALTGQPEGRPGRYQSV